MNNQPDFKQQLVKHLKGGQAFSPIDKVLNEMPYQKIGIVHNGLPYSFYQLFAHIRIAQLDILEYCRNDTYQAPNWPDEYWPEAKSPDSEQKWQLLIDSYCDERDEFCEMLLEPSADLMKPFKANTDHNLLRQAELIIEHTAYHTGQLYIIYRLLNS